jgi:hypothetical protein
VLSTGIAPGADNPVYPALDTQFLGILEEQATWKRRI